VRVSRLLHEDDVSGKMSVELMMGLVIFILFLTFILCIHLFAISVLFSYLILRGVNDVIEFCIKRVD